MLGDGISLAERMASPPELDKADCLSRGANDFANDGAAHGIDDASELGEKPVARGLDDAASTVRDGRLDQFVKMRVKPCAAPSMALDSMVSLRTLFASWV